MYYDARLKGHIVEFYLVLRDIVKRTIIKKGGYPLGPIHLDTF